MPNEIMIEGLLVRDGNGYLYFVPDEHLDLTQLQLPEDQQPGGIPCCPMVRMGTNFKGCSTTVLSFGASAMLCGVRSYASKTSPVAVIEPVPVLIDMCSSPAAGRVDRA